MDVAAVLAAIGVVLAAIVADAVVIGAAAVVIGAAAAEIAAAAGTKPYSLFNPKAQRLTSALFLCKSDRAES